MTEAPTVIDLYNKLKSKLKLEWLAGNNGGQRKLRSPDGTLEQHVAGPLNFIHPNRIQVVGKQELSFLASLGKNSYEDAIEKVFGESTSAIILVDEARLATEEFVGFSSRTDTPLLTSSLPGPQLLDSLQYYLTDILAPRTTIHGVFMEVLGVGILLTGDSAVGKSELALELISRGHRLIADDAPIFSRTSPDIISGECPPMLQDFLEVRGLGLLDIRNMFGDNAIKLKKFLRLIIQLRKLSELKLEEYDRLEGTKGVQQLLNVDIPMTTLPIAPGRNLAVLVEATVRKHILELQGFNAVKRFEARQRALIDAPKNQPPGQKKL